MKKDSTIKRTNTLALFAIMLTSLFFAEYSAAQSLTLVEIYNDSGEARKACMYRADDTAAAVPSECFEMDHREAVLWDRKGDRSNFRIKIFNPALIDKILHDRELPGGTTTIMIRRDGKIFFGGDPRNAPVTKYRLKVCNQRFNEKISFALSFETDAAFFTEGWWSVEKGKCVELGVSERLKQSMNLAYGNMPRTYFYARTHGDNPQFWYWSGNGDGRSFCINEKKAFKILGERGPAGNFKSAPCTESNQKMASFRRIDDPKTNQAYYYLTF